MRTQGWIEGHSFIIKPSHSLIFLGLIQEEYTYVENLENVERNNKRFLEQRYSKRVIQKVLEEMGTKEWPEKFN